MANRTQVLKTIDEAKLIAVVRYDDPKPIMRALAAVVEGGVRILEVTLTVPNALQIITEAVREFDGKAIIGAGTVLELDTAKAALEAGATFIVAPIVNQEVINYCAMNEAVVMPGAFTPTEIVAAWNAGADIVKVFPADSLGPPFFKAMRLPFPKIRLMPTGGVNLNSARPFLDAGAVCLGIGSQLLDPKLIAAGNFEAIRDKAWAYAQIVHDYKNRK
jgi:2-dehydro-3-deoxyphosphogluconate aldolase/(4S)-4-hydroxy-2-oxoglutarate aldolase